MTKNDIIIFEGVNCSGKSTLSQAIQLRIKFSILLKLSSSPFYFEKQDGEYEEELYNMSYSLIKASNQNTFILDRYYLSEMVYSDMYKSYSVEYYQDLNQKLDCLNRYIYIFLLVASEETIKRRIEQRLSVTSKDKIYGQKINEISTNYLTIQEKYIEKLSLIRGTNFIVNIIENNSTIDSCLSNISNIINDS